MPVRPFVINRDVIEHAPSSDPIVVQWTVMGSPNHPTHAGQIVESVVEAFPPTVSGATDALDLMENERAGMVSRGWLGGHTMIGCAFHLEWDDGTPPLTGSDTGHDWTLVVRPHLEEMRVILLRSARGSDVVPDICVTIEMASPMSGQEMVRMTLAHGSCGR